MALNILSPGILMVPMIMRHQNNICTRVGKVCTRVGKGYARVGKVCTRVGKTKSTLNHDNYSGSEIYMK